METNEDLREKMISTANAFRFDQSRLDATTLSRTARQRRLRRRLLGGVAAVAAVAATTSVALTQRGESSNSVVLQGSGEVHLVPAATPDGLVLRRSSALAPSPSTSYFNAFYGDGDRKRVAVITVLRDGLGASTATPRAVATSSGFWMPWSPRSGVEVDVATVGMSQQETEALFDRVGVDATRGSTAYGLLALPQGFHLIGDERDTTITSATMDVYATAQANLADPASAQPRADVTVGHASDIYREIDRIVFDERSTVAIRGHEADVVTHRSNADHGTIVTVSWFEQPGVVVDVTAYNMAADDAVAFARKLEPVTLDEWTAFRATAHG